MQIKKQVMLDIKKRMAESLGKVHMELNQNRFQINKLAERQHVLKNLAKELYKHIRLLSKD
jgi:hypothetical protein